MEACAPQLTAAQQGVGTPRENYCYRSTESITPQGTEWKPLWDSEQMSSCSSWEQWATLHGPTAAAAAAGCRKMFSTCCYVTWSCYVNGPDAMTFFKNSSRHKHETKLPTHTCFLAWQLDWIASLFHFIYSAGCRFHVSSFLVGYREVYILNGLTLYWNALKMMLVGLQ